MNTYKIQDLIAVHNITETEAFDYVNANSDVERQIIDITRISRLSTFSAKIAKTIIANNFKSVSSRQAEILEQDSIETISITGNCEDYFIKMIEKQKKSLLA